MMLETVMKYWVTWACGIIAGAFVLFRKKVVSWYQLRKQKREADEYADRYVLYLKLRELFKVAQEQGYITVADLDEAKTCYKHYHVMGGNGRATVMLEAMEDMEVRQ